MAGPRRAREAPGADAGGLDRSRGAGGPGADGRSPRPMAGVLYGAGLRLMECVRLRVKDRLRVSQITVRDGKGEKDRITILPALLQVNLSAHLERVKAVHREGLNAE
jgi:site-specific recombinase XerD